MIVSEPPFSMLRAAPKSFGGYSAAESTAGQLPPAGCRGGELQPGQGG